MSKGNGIGLVSLVGPRKEMRDTSNLSEANILLLFPASDIRMGLVKVSIQPGARKKRKKIGMGIGNESKRKRKRRKESRTKNQIKNQ